MKLSPTTYALVVLLPATIYVWLLWSHSTHGVDSLILREAVVLGAAALLFTIRFVVNRLRRGRRARWVAMHKK